MKNSALVFPPTELENIYFEAVESNGLSYVRSSLNYGGTNNLFGFSVNLVCSARERWSGSAFHTPRALGTSTELFHRGYLQLK